jgi:hypothetical protein
MHSTMLQKLRYGLAALMLWLTSQSRYDDVPHVEVEAIGA